jgi:site-specific recombinase XerD
MKYAQSTTQKRVKSVTQSAAKTKVKKPIIANSTKTEAFNRAEVALILKSTEIPLEERAYVALASFTGLRVSEMLSIKVDQVILPSKTGAKVITMNSPLKVRKTLTVVKTNLKGGNAKKSRVRDRIVPISKKCHAIIIAYIKSRSLLKPHQRLTRDKFLFASRNLHSNKAINPGTVWRRLKRMGDILGMKMKNLSSHSCRKFFAAVLFLECKNMEMVSRIIGHASVRTTKMYVDDGLWRVDPTYGFEHVVEAFG